MTSGDELVVEKRRVYRSQDGWLFDRSGALVRDAGDLEIVTKSAKAVADALTLLEGARLPLFGQPLPTDKEGRKAMAMTYATAVDLARCRIECIVPAAILVVSGKLDVKAFPDAATFVDLVKQAQGRMYVNHGAMVGENSVHKVLVPVDLDTAARKRFASATLAQLGVPEYVPALPAAAEGTEEQRRVAVEKARQNIRDKLGLSWSE
jgi:hypothetical protein